MNPESVPVYHLTVKWPSALPGQPEVMVNAYLPSPGELAAAFEEIASIAAESYGLPRPRNAFEAAREEVSQAEPTPIHQAKQAPPAQSAEEVARALAPHCPVHGTEMLKGQYNYRCTSPDPSEPTGWCRMIQDARGTIRRQATRAELAARKAASQ